MVNRISLVLVCALALTACQNKAAEPPPVPPTPVTPQHVPVMTPKTYPVKIDKLGILFDGPKGCSVRDAKTRQTVQCRNMSFDVFEPSRHDPRTYEQAQKEERRHTGLVITSEQKNPDGWNLRFHTGDTGVEMYFSWIRRSIGGKPYECDAMATSADEAARDAEACEHLAPLH